MTESGNAKKEYLEVKTSFWDYTTVLSSNFFLMFLSLISSTLTARILGAKGLGTFALFQMFVQPIFLYVAGWTSSAVLRYGKEELVLENKINKVFWSRNFIILIGMLIVFPAVVIFRKNITQYTGLPHWTIWLLIGYVFVTIIYNYLEYIFQAIRWLKQYALLRALEKFVFVIGLSLVVFKIFSGKVITIISLSLFGMLLLAIIGYIIIGYKTFFPIQIDKLTLKKILRFSLPLLIGGTCSYIISWVDIVVIKTYLSVEEVGVYSLAYQGMTVIQQIAISTIAVLLPLIVSLKVQNREDLVVRYAERFVPQGLFIWLLTVSLIIIPISYYLIPFLFGKDFSWTVLSFNILLIGLAANFLACLYSPIENAYELTRLTQIPFILIAVVNVVGDLILIPQIGTPGAAISTVAGYTVGFIYYSYICSRRIKVSLKIPLMLITIICLSFIFFNFIKVWYGRLLAIGVILCYSLWLAKKLGLFRKEDEKILEYINMPGVVKTVISKIYYFSLWTK